MLEIGVELESILITLTQVALSESRGDDAEKLACIQEQIAKQFGILECTAYTAKLECAINKKDAECCTKILSSLLASMEKSSNIFAKSFIQAFGFIRQQHGQSAPAAFIIND
ncbi:MAG: hypothetical protein V8R75_07015 [Oscillospiraceae bacterium]